MKSIDILWGKADNLIEISLLPAKVGFMPCFAQAN